MGRKWLIIILVLALFVGGFFFRAPKMAHIQLPAEKVFEVGGFPVVNTMLSTWVTMVVLLVLAWLGTRRIREVPGRLQSLLEVAVEAWIGLVESVAGPAKGRRFFTIVASIFLFILVNNWLGLFPFFGSLGFWEAAEAGKEAAAEAAHAAEAEPLFVPLLRSASTDLNTTIALALVSVALTQVYGVQHLGFGSYAAKFVNLRGGPIGLFVGVLELVSEFAKIISLSFRLFGNMFAGEVLLATMAFLIPWVASVPFMGLELFVGLMQAFVFAILTLVFMTMATTSHEEHAESHH